MPRTSRNLPTTILITSVTAVICLTCSASIAAETTNRSIDFVKEIKPILRQRCFACHGGLQQKANLRLDTVASILKGSDSGPAVVANDPDSSPMVARIIATDTNIRMPPDGKPLEPNQVAKIREWIQSGVQVVAGDVAEPDPRDHWAFQKPVRPRFPASTTTVNPIDAFINEQLAKHQLSLQPPAEKTVLLRRLYLDLVGVPPTRAELLAYLADESPNAYEAAVERLLRDVRYGERWARHWMDIWRYADWHGRRQVPDVWNSAPQIWRWRDWIVQSLNEDHGYDRMVREMLAGDEVAGDEARAVVATGYMIRNWYALNPNDWMRSNVEHTSKAFLGLTFHCAHCHDHKYDPMTQEDYFRLRAFFEPIGVRQDRVAGEANPGPFQEYDYSVLRKVQRLGAVQVFDKSPAAPTWLYTGGDERNRVVERGAITPGVPAFLGGDKVAIREVTLPVGAWYPAMRPEILETILGDERTIIAKASQELVTVRSQVSEALPPLEAKVVEAQTALDQTMKEAVAQGRSGVLQGRQSLLLDATTGRRTIQNRLRTLKTLNDATTISFLIRIVRDAHVNFQLAKDLEKGLTAAYVAFDAGKIMSYHPGGFTEFQAGAYDLRAGQERFQVTLKLETAADRALLTIQSLADQKVLVEQVPIAINGWNPIGDPTKGISFDARPGVVAVVDDLQIAFGGMPLVSFPFEAPEFVDQQDVVGVAGWELSQYAQPPATSLVSSTIGDNAVTMLAVRLRDAKRAVEAQRLRVQSLETKIAAAEAEIVGIEARIAADRARHDPSHANAPQPLSIEELVDRASEKYRAAAIKKAEAEVIAADLELATAEAKPVSDSGRAKAIEAATKQLASTKGNLEKAKTASADSAMKSTFPSVGPKYSATSTGRRKALSEWMTSRDNPLTARVAVNHIWLRHFHVPLVATVTDFGRNGAKSSHPDLLDWLSVEFMESGWSMKHLHRLIVTSQAYRRQSSASGSDCAKLDSENRWLWRMNVGRMEAEVVRDSILALSGRLDTTVGGQELENDKAFSTFRRSMYYSCHPELDGKNPFTALFDAPEPTDCYRRTRSVIPQQSLALTNSELVHDTCGPLATLIWNQLSEGERNNEAFIDAAFQHILTRAPRANERPLCQAFFGQPAPSEADQVRVREGFVRVLLNHNDFISIR